MLVKMTVDLPYSWCLYCTRLELKAIEFRAEDNKSETDHTCANVSICEAAEDAKLRERAAAKRTRAMRHLAICAVRDCKRHAPVYCCEECPDMTCRERCHESRGECGKGGRDGNIEGKSID